MYPNVSNIHLKTIIDFNTVGGDFKYLHEIGEGPCAVKSGYGIFVAELCGFPPSLIEETKRIQNIVKTKFQNLIHLESTAVDRTIGTISSLLERVSLLKESTLDDNGVRAYLSSLVQKLTPDMRNDILELIDHYEQSSNTSEPSQVKGALQPSRGSIEIAEDGGKDNGTDAVDESKDASRLLSHVGLAPQREGQGFESLLEMSLKEEEGSDSVSVEMEESKDALRLSSQLNQGFRQHKPQELKRPREGLFDEEDDGRKDNDIENIDSQRTAKNATPKEKEFMKRSVD